MKRHLVTCLLVFGCLLSAARAEMPGAWVELEAGQGHTAFRPNPAASGGRAVSWFGQGKTVWVDFKFAGAMSNARIYLRYQRGADAKGALEPGQLLVYLGPTTARRFDAEGVRKVGTMELANLGDWTKFGWATLGAGNLPAGDYRLFITNPMAQDVGALDLVGLVPDVQRGIWVPPNVALNGQLQGDGTLSAPVELVGLESPDPTGLLAENIYTGKSARPVVIQARVHNLRADGVTRCEVSGELRQNDKLVQKFPARQVEIQGTVTAGIPLKLDGLDRGSYDLRVQVQSEGYTFEKKLSLSVVPFAPVWQEAETGNKSVGSPQASAGKVATLWFSDTTPLGININVPQDLPEALLYFRYARVSRDHNLQPGPVDVAIGPASATSLNDKGVRQLGRVILLPGTKTQPFLWDVVNAGALPAGQYRVFFTVPQNPVPVPASVNQFDLIGLLPATDRGLWLPANEVAGGKLSGEATRRAPVELLKIATPATGNLILGATYIGAKAKPLTMSVQMRNYLANAPLTVTINGELSNDQGVVAKLPTRTHTLGAGATEDVSCAMPALDYGWYELKLQVTAEGQTATIQNAFGLLLPPVKGLRPDSMFGLGMGSHPEDMEVAETIGVKWRRGIPHTDPIDVLPKEGQWWDQAAIDKARQSIREAKDHGIMSLGYVNYNIPWNVRPDPLGRKIYQHQNRPQDLKLQAEMVYHMIKPLADEVKYWEVWNEPWVRGWTWRDGTAQDYRDMTRLIWDRVKPEMPDVMLIGGGSTPYMRDVVYAQGAENAGYIDGNSTHPYGIPDLNTPSITALESVMNQRWSKSGGKGGIWATEVGTAEMMFDQLPPAERKYAVARSVAPIYLLNKLGAGATPMRAFFFISNYGTSNFSGGDNNLWDGTNPKPGLVAYSAMTHFLEDATLQGDLFAACKGAWAMHFTRQDGSSVVALWTEKGINGRIFLDAQNLEAYDYLGRPVGSVQNGKLELPLREGEVRYLVFQRPADAVRQCVLTGQWRDVPALGIYPRSFTAPLQRKPALRVKVENLLPQQLDGTLDISSSPGLQLVTSHAELAGMKPGEIREVEFPLASATANAVNRYPIAYRARAGVIDQSGQQVVQVAVASYGTPQIDGDLSDWAGVVPTTMVSRGGKDYRQIMLNPDLAKQLIGENRNTDTVLYRLWTRWDEKNLYVAAEIPDATLTTNSTFEDDPYSFPFLVDCLQMAFGCLQKNPDDLLRGNPLYEKSTAADVDYEFAATLARYTGAGPKFAAKPAWNGNWATAPRIPQLQRLVAPGTNFQTFYPTNPALKPPVGPLRTTADNNAEGQIAIIYDDAKQVLRYEMAISWNCLPELGRQVNALKPGESLPTRFAWGVNDAGGRGRTFWQQEAGEVQPGGYGFSPHWGGGNRDFGGRILTDWGFYRDPK